MLIDFITVCDALHSDQFIISCETSRVPLRQVPWVFFFKLSGSGVMVI